jgi:gamma-glutamylcysteine synthetase
MLANLASRIEANSSLRDGDDNALWVRLYEWTDTYGTRSGVRTIDRFGRET